VDIDFTEEHGGAEKPQAVGGTQWRGSTNGGHERGEKISRTLIVKFLIKGDTFGLGGGGGEEHSGQRKRRELLKTSDFFGKSRRKKHAVGVA